LKTSRFGVVGGVLAFAVIATVSLSAHAEPPKAREGFQMAVRTGVALPFGDADKSVSMSDISTAQVPLLIDLGGKLGRNVFLGAYVGFGFGGASRGLVDDMCEVGNVTCVTVSVRLGAQVQYHFRPAESVNPWLGYGIGFESFGVGASRSGSPDRTAVLVGPEFAHLMGGVDFRLGKVFGIGPFVDYSIGQYGSATVKVGDISTDYDLADKAIHHWLTLGVRGTFLP
jgi:hypothetical protein